MKEELLQLKGIAMELPGMLKKFNADKKVFNGKVEEMPDAMLKLDSYYDALCDTYYDEALNFYGDYEFLYEAAADLREAHPKYGDKRIAKTLFEQLSHRVDATRLNEAIELYILLKNIGFNELLEQQDKIAKIEEQSGLLATGVAREAKEKAIGTGKKAIGAVSDFARPYGEIALGQFFTAKDAATEQFGIAKGKAMNAVSNGSKRLAKIFTDLADKTSTDNK